MTDVNKILVSAVHESLANNLKQLAQAENTPLAAVANYSLHYINLLENTIINKVAPSEIAQARASALAQVTELLGVELHPFTNPIDAFVTVKEKTDEADKESSDVGTDGSIAQPGDEPIVEGELLEANGTPVAAESAEPVVESK